MCKKIIASVAAIAIAFGAVGVPAVESGISVGSSISASADDEETLTYGDYTYKMLDNDTVEITDYNGESTTLVIPSKIDGKAVTSIGYSAFMDCENLTSVSVPNSITSIGDDAFWNCKKLTNISIPESVTSIGYYAFCECRSLKSIIIPNSITNINDGTFSSCDNLTDITIPNSVTRIGMRAFENCINLESLSIPNSVTNIEDWAFFECTSLTNLKIPNSVTRIGWYAFAACRNIKDITIPNCLEIIEIGAFSDCVNLKNITISDSVTIIQMETFWNCPNLTSVTIPSSVTNIEYGAFGYFYNEYGNSTTFDNFKIYCYKDTTGEQYAKDNGFDYELLDATSHEHTYTAKVTKAATCTTAGTKTYTCKCGESYTETIPATGKHTVVTDKAVAATCTTAGKTEGSHCSVCGTVIKAQTTVKAKGHTYDSGKITKAATCTADGVKTYTCTVCKKTKTETVKATGHKYTVTKIVKPTATAQGYTLKTCSVCKSTTKTDYTAKLIAMSKSAVSGVKSTYAYTGKAIAPTVTVKYGKTTLKKGTDYTVSYKNNKATGKATATITGKGKYSGTKTVTYIIVPKKATVSTVKSAKTKTVTVKWKKDSQASGYQLVYSTNSKFKSSKSVNIAKNSTVSKTLTKLTKGKTYYVKVRAYKTISGKKYYGAYSAVKSVKCK